MNAYINSIPVCIITVYTICIALVHGNWKLKLGVGLKNLKGGGGGGGGGLK